MKMTTYFYIVILTVLCLFVIFSSENDENDPNSIVKITQKQFDASKCSKVCTNPALKRKLENVCVKLWNELHLQKGKKTVYSYDEKTVRSTTACLEHAQVDLLNDQGSTRTFTRKIGLCYFSAAIQKCVSKSVNSESTIYYYTYDRVNNNCYNPREMQYELSATATETILAYIRSWCLGG